jgi:hypothetical protein
MPTKAVRIGFGPQGGNWDSFDKRQRERIQTAYGHRHRISEDAWQKIEAITGMLAFSTPITKSAAPLSVILKKTKKLVDAAKSLRVSLLAGAPAKRIVSAEALPDVYVKYFQHDPSKLELADIYPFLLTIAEGTISLGDFVDRVKPSDLPAGRFWGLWIIMIAKILKSHGLPITARKDSGKKTKDSSPFISMICALHEELPPECRPQNNSLDAVAQAYHRARARDG